MAHAIVISNITNSAGLVSPSVLKPISTAISNVSDQTTGQPVTFLAGAKQLLQALWRSSNQCHQIGILDRKTQRFQNMSVDSVDQAITQLNAQNKDGLDLYFACAEFSTPDNRTATNSIGAYGFWMDIDCSELKANASKGYLTIDEAEAAIEKFCEQTGLARPTHIVSSGCGLHVYWVLDKILYREPWLEYAKKLKALTENMEFRADPSRTADIASVLRIPGTSNFKHGSPRPVILQRASDTFIDQASMLATIDGAFEKFCTTTPKPSVSSLRIPSPTREINIDREATMPSFGPPNIEKLSSALASLDPDCDETTWKLRRLGPLAREARKHPELANPLYQLAKDWSSGELGGQASKAWITPGRSNNRCGKQVFDSVWQRFLNESVAGNQTSIGSIYHDAAECGWVDPTTARATSTGSRFQESNAERFSKQEDTKSTAVLPGKSAETPKPTTMTPLKAIQQQFALINIDGKLWVIDHRNLTEYSSQGSAQKMSFSNRSDGTMLIRRFLKAQFPESNLEGIERKFFEDPETTCYDGLEFNPTGSTTNRLNLWVGPTILPRAGDWSLIRSFLLDIICDGDDTSYQYLIRFIAHALQFPEDKPGIMIVLLGGQGTGKGTLGRILHSIWSRTFLQVYNIDSVTGNFNASLERAFIVFMDEALFVGDRRASDALKSLVTEPLIQINEKYQPARQTRSYLRFFAATNADHFKNTERDDRRDFVLRLSESRKGDHSYWRELHHSISNGAVEAMVAELLAMDLADFNVRAKPSTAALMEQKLQSLDHVARWWYDYLNGGGNDEDTKWPEFVSTEWIVTAVYDMAAGRIHRKPSATDIVRVMKKLCPSAVKKQLQKKHHRCRGLALPSLEQARAEFEHYVGGAVPWDQ